MADGSDDRLDSWKGIAVYLGRTERTAMRWAASRGLPVHRVHGELRGPVFAYRREIDAWLAGLGARAARSSTVPDSEPHQAGEVEAPAAFLVPLGRRRLLRSALLLAVSAVALGGLVLVVSRIVLSSRGPRETASGWITGVTFTPHAVLAWDGGRQLWQYRFPHPLDPGVLGWDETLENFVRIVHLRRPARTVVILVAPLRLGPNPNSPYETQVDCFSSGGKLLWSYVPQERFQFGANKLQGPWHVTSLYLSNTSSEPQLWVAEDHYEWGNTFVVQLDLGTGLAKLRYVNTGVLYALDEVKTPSGTYLLAGGFNNEYSAGIMAVINEKKQFAASPQTPGTRHQCVSCPPGVPDEYFVFPRTEINRAEEVYEDPVRRISVLGDQIEVRKAEAQGRAQAGTIYLFHSIPSIWPISLRYDSSYNMLYRGLENEGRIHHSFAESPEQLHPQPVSVWTPSRGWAECDFRSPGIASSEARPVSKAPRYLLAAAPQR
jgi:hypothetical protein